MPAYLVELPVQPGLSNIVEGGAMVVFASDATDALAIADGHFGQDAKGLFAAVGTATEIVAGSNLSGYALRVRVFDATDNIDVSYTPSASIIGAAPAPTIQAGGTGYTVNDILTVGGGTLAANGHATRLRVTSVNVGVVDGIELVDPGTYAALPTNPVAVTGGTGGDNATFNLTSNGGLSYEAVFTRIVDLLNLDALIAGATIDVSSGVRLLTAAAAGDSLGDHTLTVTVSKNGVAVPSLVGAITDEGAAGAALTAALTAAASVVNPNMLRVLKRT